MGVFTMDMISYQMGKNSAPQPSGSLSITENGTYDVTEKASAVVNVQGGQSGLPIEIASSCPSPFLLQQTNIALNGFKYIFPTTTASVVPTSDTTTPYIQSSGTQYIDSGVSITDNYIRIKVKCLSTVLGSETSSYRLWAGGGASGHPCALKFSYNPLYLEVGGTENFNTGVSYSVNTIIEADIIANNGNISGTINEQSISGTYSGSVVTETGICPYLFASNEGGSADYFYRGKLYYFEVYDSNGLVRDFTPAISQETGHTNEVCLYDNVTNAYFYNQGTGTFTWGEDIAPVTKVDVGDEVKTKLSPTNDYANFTYQWQKMSQSAIISGTDNFTNYTKNSSANSAYKSITYDSTTNVNTCVIRGVGGFERIGYRNTVPAGQTISYKLKYKSEVAVASSGTAPNAPYMFIGASSVLNNTDFIYGDNSKVYSSQVLPVTVMSDYVEYICSYTNNTESNIEVAIGLDTGGTADGVTRTFYVKDMGIGGFAFADISGATSSTYTAQTGDNAIRCILTGTGNSEGTITSSSIEVQEVD